MSKAIKEEDLLSLVRLAATQNPRLGERMISEILEIIRQRSHLLQERLHLLEKLVGAENPEEVYRHNIPMLNGMKVSVSSRLKGEDDVEPGGTD